MIQSVFHSESDVTQSDYCLRPNVIFLLIQDGSARLLDLGGNFYTISQIGAEMLNETLKVGAATAAGRIATKYGVELSYVQNDLYAFLHNLEEKRLIRRFRKSRRAIRYTEILQFMFFMPLLRCISRFPTSLEKRTWALLMLATISIHLFEWPGTIAVWRYCLQKNASTRATGKLKRSAQELDEIVRTAASRHPLRVECKERALSCWWLLSSAGIPAKLVLGVQLFPLKCHCWCEAGQLVLTDDRDQCGQFTPVLSYE